MKITAVRINQNCENGLKPIEMSRLSDLVLVAGQNGSGKSRLFQKITALALSKTTRIELDQLTQQINNFESSISQYQSEINVWQMQNTETNLVSIQNHERTIKSWQAQMNQMQNICDLNRQIELDGADNQKPQIINFVPKSLNLSPYSNQAISSIRSNADGIHNLGINHVSSGALAYIKNRQDKWREAKHPEQLISNEEKTDIISSYDTLCNLIKTIMGTELTRDSDSNPFIFGFPIENANFSDGQKVLLQLAVAIHAQNTQLSEVILMLDEPENHLHPSAIIEVIERLRSLVSNGQIWIATHSIPLLAHFGHEYIWYMENGGIEYAGKKADKVLNSLLGNEEARAKLHNFVGLPAELASTQYAFECLFTPKTVMTDANDPQIGQIRSIITERIDSQGELKILDFGAGKGRLISNIVETENKGEIIEKLTYVAFDPFPDDKNECLTNIQRIFNDSSNKYFNDMNQLLTEHDKSSFDLVILCNVLHEISPEEWISLFQSKGHITQLLKDSGYLLMVEDQHIPTGEKAYTNGFLVLDTPQLKTLFAIKTEADTNFKYAAARDGRLKAHLIPKNCLSRITVDSKKEAIQEIKNLAKNKIKELRSSDQKDYKSGQLHGFWVQQLANAELILTP